ncbi:MAG: hypothetical protein LBG80_18865 [Bacteroidales bacterium]|jgi:hypothetical protein|nr:hypothetical protein [Bacteroidales bacterium]
MKNISESVDIISNIIQVGKGNGKYDVLVPISGGKDGLWILSVLGEIPGIKIAALHIDNYFISNKAKENILKAASFVDFDLIELRPMWRIAQTIYRALLMNMGEICIACEGLISSLPIEVASHIGIPYVVWGLTPSQLAQKRILNGRDTINYAKYNRIQKYYEGLIYSLYRKTSEEEKAKEVIDNLFSCQLSENSFFPEYIYPFHFTGYDAEIVEKNVSERIEWKRAMDVGGTSSNCYINQLHIYLKNRLRGKDLYKQMVESKFAAGEVIKDVAESALNREVKASVLDDILQKLNISVSIDELVKQIESFKKDIQLQIESNISR